MTLGIIAARLFKTRRKTSVTAVLMGLLSGTCTAIVGLLLFRYFTLQGYYWRNGIIDVIRIYIGWDTFIITLLVSIILQSLGVLYHAACVHSGTDKDADATRIIARILCKSKVFFVILLATLVVIPLTLFALPADYGKFCADDMCQPGLQCARIPVPDNISVSRTGPNSIRIGLKTIDPCGTGISYRIILNGTDVSNQAQIAKTGLNVTISPRDGLGRKDGDFVVLQGSDVTINKTYPLHLQVNGTPKGMNIPLVFSDQYL
ncbi:MAG: hypothetical protein M0Q92_12025 [Methanoregula sp.]|nr:hypothetical protein [Methanoregula sp.]